MTKKHNDILQLVGTLYGPKHEVTHLRFSADGKMIGASEDEGNGVYIWSTNTFDLLKKVVVGQAVIHDFAFSPAEPLLAIAKDSLILWDYQRGQIRLNLPIKAEQVRFSPDGRMLFTVTGGAVSIWSIEQQRPLFTFQVIPHHLQSGCFALAPDASCLALVSSESESFLWMLDSNFSSAMELATLKADFEEGVAFSPDGHFLATLAYDRPQKSTYKGIMLYDVQQLTLVDRITIKYDLLGTERMQPLAFSHDGALLAIAAMDGIMFLWDILAEHIVTSWAAHDNPTSMNYPYYGIRAVEWSPTSRLLATGGWITGAGYGRFGGFAIKLWNVM